VGIPQSEIDHFDNMVRRMDYIRRAYNKAADNLTSLLLNANYRDNKTTSFFDINRTLSKQVDDILLRLNAGVYSNIDNGIVTAWDLANEGNDRLVSNYIKGATIKPKMLESFYQLNTWGLDAFSNRVVEGMNLSERVWSYVGMSKDVLEEYLGSGILTGRSAAKVSQDVREALKEPNKLFRRVRNKDGKLVLSKAAQAYHPGQGVYRSSYQNALRLAATEINMSYRTSDFLRRQNLPFVTGFTVHLSAAHPRVDICDHNTGDYPKGFLFVGWHPRCICYTTSKLLPPEDFKKYLNTGMIAKSKYTQTLPPATWGWIYAHQNQIRRWKSVPYWLQDNFTNDFHLKKNVITRSTHPGAFDDTQLMTMIKSMR
jgi:hypothetical protein